MPVKYSVVKDRTCSSRASRKSHSPPRHPSFIGFVGTGLPPAASARSLPSVLYVFRLGLVGLGRFELPTSPLSGVRSNQLSYRPEKSVDSHHLCYWWSWSGSNRRPPECKSGALPTELQPRMENLQNVIEADWMQVPSFRLCSSLAAWFQPSGRDGRCELQIFGKRVRDVFAAASVGWSSRTCQLPLLALGPERLSPVH